MGGGKSFTSSSQKYCFYELEQVRWFHMASIPPEEVSQAIYYFVVEITPIQYILTSLLDIVKIALFYIH